jgi:adenylosuccinate synthase
VEDLARARPVYRTLPGWKTDISQDRRLADFPKQARAYLETLSELIGKPVEIISVGPDREQTIFRGKV